jgi:hypothetical protein
LYFVRTYDRRVFAALRNISLILPWAIWQETLLK